jgi:hypothetical protein
MKENKSFCQGAATIWAPLGLISLDIIYLQGYNTLNGLSRRREQKREASQEKPKEAETSPRQSVPCSISTGSCTEKNLNMSSMQGICRNIKELVV